MTHQWFWQTRGELFGPLTTDELENLFRRNRIADLDKLRIDESGEWLSAADVKEMFNSPADPSAQATAQLASRVLSQAHRRRLEQPVEEPSASGLLAEWFGAGGRAAAGFLADCRNRMWDGFDLVARLVTHKLVLIAMGIVVLAVVAVLFRNVRFGDGEQQDIQVRLSETWAQLRSLNQKGASDSEWAQFRDETLAWLTDSIKGLEEAARGGQASQEAGYGQRELIFAGRILKAHLSDRREPTERQAHIFATHMTKASQYLKGEISFKKLDAAEREARRREELTAQGRQQLQQEQQSKKYWITATAVAGVGMVGAGLLFWWRRR